MTVLQNKKKMKVKEKVQYIMDYYLATTSVEFLCSEY